MTMDGNSGGGDSSAPIGDVSGSESTEESPAIEAEGNQEQPSAMKQMAEKIARKYKVKVDGEEAEVDEDELISNYQLRKSSDKRFQEGIQARKQAEEFIKLLKTDPAKVFSHPAIGSDFKEIAEQFLLNEMQNEMMSDEERQLVEYKQKLAKYEEQERTTKEQAEAKQKEEVRNKYADDYNKQITGALETSGLPKTEFTVQRMIHYMAKGLEKGYELSANDVTDLVRRDYIRDTKALYSGLDAEALMQIMGDDVASKIRKFDLNKIKNPKNSLQEPQRVAGSKGGQQKSNKMTKDQWRDLINSRT